MDILSTLFHLQSRNIGILVPSVVVSEKHTDKLEITEHPVETGAAISDHAYKSPSEVIMDVGFAGGGELLDFKNELAGPPLLGMSPRETYQQLLDLQSSRTPLDVVTGKRIYKNMLLRSIEVNTDQKTENVLSALLTLREVIITSTLVTQVADKSNMAQGANTSAVQNAGVKTATPANKTILKSKGILGGQKGASSGNILGRK
ncbi:phage baseplate protein [Phytobacter sp. RSE-02]|uniref:phage baseplate protein n=1 Tax=Phytobacter sp. RSE-02 TaxID=3229229 RepID=UPI00339D3E52